MSRRLLLISSSTCHPTGYLDHAETELRDFLGGLRRVLFLPWALFDHDAYEEKVRERFRRMGYEVASAHTASDPRRALEEAEAVFTGGGNTFRLLKALYDLDLVSTLRRRALEGMPYVGSSAGTNVACVSIRTTNDMPIVEPPSLSALALVPFNINPHYRDPDPASTHKGETREERIRQFHEENDPPVLAMREGAMLRVEGERARLVGQGGARLFRKNEAAAELSSGTSVDFLMRFGEKPDQARFSEP